MYEAGVPVSEIAEAFGRTPNAIAEQVRAMGFHNVSVGGGTPKYHKWTKEDDALLREEYGKLYVSEIAWELDTSEESVIARAAKLGLRRPE